MFVSDVSLCKRKHVLKRRAYDANNAFFERDVLVMLSLPSKISASFYATVSVSFWGISFVSTKAVLDKLDPYSLLVIRFGIGALFLLCLLLLKRHSLRLSIIHLPHLIILGILGVFVHQLIQATALISIDASQAGWIISFSPIFTVLLSMAFLHEKMSPPKIAGILLSLCGVLLVTTTGEGKSFHLAMNLGYILMIASTLNWAIYSVLLKRLYIPLPSLVVTFYMSLLGFILTLPFLVRNRGWEQIELLSKGEWAHLLFLGVFVSGVAYWYWGKAHEVLDASKASVFMYLEPVATLLAAMILLHEHILFLSVAGGILIIIGVVFVNGQFVSLFHRLTWKNRNS